MYKLAKKITNRLIQTGLPKEKEAIYTYSLEILLNCSFIFFILFIYSLLTNSCLSMFLWISSFFVLRTRIGGLHMNTNEKCIGASCVLAIFCVWISTRITWLDKIEIYLFAIEFLYLILFVPFNSTKFTYVGKQRSINKIIASTLYVFLYFVACNITLYSCILGRTFFIGIHASIILSAMACIKYYLKEFLYD